MYKGQTDSHNMLTEIKSAETMQNKTPTEGNETETRLKEGRSQTHQ